MSETVAAHARLWRWEGGPAAWHFITLAGEAADTIAAHSAMSRLEGGRGRGFGSVRVIARIGTSRWPTSVFPLKQEGYLLPVKAAIRRAEAIAEGDEVEVELELL